MATKPWFRHDVFQHKRNVEEYMSDPVFYNLAFSSRSGLTDPTGKSNSDFIDTLKYLFADGQETRLADGMTPTMRDNVFCIHMKGITKQHVAFVMDRRVYEMCNGYMIKNKYENDHRMKKMSSALVNEDMSIVDAFYLNRKAPEETERLLEELLIQI